MATSFITLLMLLLLLLLLPWISLLQLRRKSLTSLGTRYQVACFFLFLKRVSLIILEHRIKANKAHRPTTSSSFSFFNCLS